MADSIGYYNWEVKIIPSYGKSYSLLVPYWTIANKIIRKFRKDK